MLITEFIQFPLTLVVYGVAHSLPRGGVGWDFPFNEDETRRHFSYLSDRGSIVIKNTTNNKTWNLEIKPNKKSITEGI